MPERKIPSDVGEPLEVYPVGRRCTNCGTKLNRYNGLDVCHLCRRKLFLKGERDIEGQKVR